MCDPLTIAAVAATTAGGYYQGKTQQNYHVAQQNANDEAFAMSETARLREQERQDKYSRQGEDYVRKLTAGQGVQELEAARAEGEQDFVSQLATRSDPGIVAAPAASEGASVEVKKDMARRVNSAAAESRERVRALARLQGYGGGMFDRALEQQEAGDFLSMLGSQRRGSLAVGAQEQDVRPNSVQPGDPTLGMMLSAAGTAMAGAAHGGGVANLWNRNGASVANKAAASAITPLQSNLATAATNPLRLY